MIFMLFLYPHKEGHRKTNNLTAVKRSLLILLTISSALLVNGQKQANYWYFGYNAGMSFNGGLPIALTNGALNTWEGCSSISDASGNLLFYTDGRFVYNKNHNQMANGSGLYGHASSTQSGIIVPKPGSTSDYYIFTVDAVDNNLANGLCYSRVDMTLNSGLGDVVTSEKNISLLPFSCEKVTAVGHSNGINTWVITHQWGTNAFYAYQVNISGVNPTPVISNMGSVISGSLENSKGYIKVSPDGTKIVMANNTMAMIEIFDFNNTNGQVTNPIQDNNFVPADGGPYGVEFSTNGRYLYISEWKSNKRIYQYDLDAGSPSAIISSRALVASVGQNDPAIGALQLGPDNRIYVARWQHGSLSRINQPNNQGSGCNWQTDALNLAGRDSGYGLPPFIQSFFFMNADYYWDSPICDGTPAQFYTSAGDDPDSVRWNFGDDPSGPLNTSTELDPTHLFSDGPRLYGVKLKIYIGGQVDSVYKLIIVRPSVQVDLGPDGTVCAATPYVIDAGEGFAHYLWSTGDTTQSIVADTSGTYWCEVQNEWGCADMDSVDLIVFPAFDIQLDAEICEGQSYYAGGANQTASGIYYDSLLTVNGCDSVITTSLLVKDTFQVYNYPQICNGDSLYIAGAWRKASGTWVENLTTVLGCDSTVTTNLLVTDVLTSTSSMTICSGESVFLQGEWRSDPGTYYDTVINTVGCDSIYVTNLAVADTFNVLTSASICDGDSIFVGGGWQKQEGIYYDMLLSVWGCDSVVYTDVMVGETKYSYHEALICDGDSIWLGGDYQKTEGEYVDMTISSSGCDSVITTQLYVNQSYYFAKDTSICEGESVLIGGEYRGEPGIYFDRLLTINGCDSIIGTEIFVELLPVVDLGRDTVLQEGTEMVLDATHSAAASYVWQDGSVEPTFTVTEQGNYYVDVTTECGTRSDSIYVRYGNFYCDAMVPTAFSPNGDQLNDTFKPYIDCEIQSYKLMIYTRWGEMIFMSTDREDSWDGTIDGKPAEVGTYVYLLVYKVGIYEDIYEKKAKGSVMLLK